jgi:hypothetical protein
MTIHERRLREAGRWDVARGEPLAPIANPHPGMVRFSLPDQPGRIHEMDTGNLPATAAHLLRQGAVIVGAWHYPTPSREEIEQHERA